MSLWGNKDTVYATGNITTITAQGVVTEFLAQLSPHRSLLLRVR